jgi:hypothetical protein
MLPTDQDAYGPLVAVLSAYLMQFEPVEEAGEGVMLKTTEQIESEIQDMIEPLEGQVAKLMLDAGFKVIYAPGGRHGWAMRYRRE